MKKFSLLILFLTLCICVNAERKKFPGGKQYVFRIHFTDKNGTPFSIHRPQEFLSQRSIERRKKQGCKIDQTDLPISPEYIKQIEKECGKVICKSKWNNSVLVTTKDPGEKVMWKQKFPFIKDIIRVWVSPDSTEVPEDRNPYELTFNKPSTPHEAHYGAAESQITQLNGIALHEAGFRGDGKSIAVIDAGFKNADVIPLLKNSRIRISRDFVWPPTNDIFNESQHGTNVLSCMATNIPNHYIGTAPEASYILLRSEYDKAETSMEEDFWCAAAEYADSLGIDLICSSLGYTTFDSGAHVAYKYKDIDGKTAEISKAASMLAQKGIIGVVSAGNSGAKTWKKINFLADANNILAVGAVNSKGEITTFSSVGNTADGRIKPDVVARGQVTQCVSPRNIIVSLNGTSFSAPTLCGMVACLWQALPNKTAKEIIEIVRNSGDNAEFPDNIYGYGVPDFWKAYQENK